METVLSSLNHALHRTLRDDDTIYILGEDLLDPYGGAFKVTRGLSDSFPGHVLTTPVSEAGVVGIAAGLALRGLRPVVEIMFGDFIPLVADQLINHIAKFQWMYNEQVVLPMVIRTPMGGYRGYGPTHSQTLEKIFMGIPGLSVVAPNMLIDPGQLLIDCIYKANSPVLFIENKSLYTESVGSQFIQSEFSILVENQSHHSAIKLDAFAPPTVSLTIRDAPHPEVTIACYGFTAKLAIEAARKLAYDQEIFSEIVIPSRLTPFELSPIIESVKRTKRLLVVEEGTFSLGWGSEVISRVVETIGQMALVCQRVAALDSPIPASRPLEEYVLPGVDSIIRKVQRMV